MVTGPRHDASRDRLFEELKNQLGASATISKERGLDPTGNLINRPPGSHARGSNFLGDVSIRGLSPLDEDLIDIGWRAVTSARVLDTSRNQDPSSTAASAVYDEKMRKGREILEIHNTQRVRFYAVGISTSGIVDPRCKDDHHPVFNRLSESAWNRIVAAGMMAQAEAGMKIISSGSS